MQGASFRFPASHDARSLAAAREQLIRLYRLGYCQLRLTAPQSALHGLGRSGPSSGGAGAAVLPVRNDEEEGWRPPRDQWRRELGQDGF